MTNSQTDPQQHEITLRFLASPQDANLFGNVHGGMVMKWIDEAAYACAVGWCGIDCVTVYIGGIRFFKPIHIGDLVETRARLIYTGRTSMHQTTHCVTVFVALDEAGRPAPIEGFIPKTIEETAMQQYAIKLMALRKGIEEEMQPYLRLD